MKPEELIDVASAAKRALGFILSRQDQSGCWYDFRLPAGRSNVWVTAFVAGVLASRPESEAAIQSAWRFLTAAAKAQGGWSYNPGVPGDADSTLWGLRLAEKTGFENTECARMAAQFLDRHRTPDGGIATYATAGPIREYIGLPDPVPFTGWTHSHVCVTAAAANLASWQRRLAPFLIANQKDDGRWESYWWFDDEYATAEAVAALGSDSTASEPSAAEPRAPASSRSEALVTMLSQPPSLGPHPSRVFTWDRPLEAGREHSTGTVYVDRAIGWAAERVAAMVRARRAGHTANSFALAHAIRVLTRAGDLRGVSTDLSAGLALLIAEQDADGSWPTAARLRVPRPDLISPPPETEWRTWEGLPPGPPSVDKVLKYTFNNYSWDYERVYTTATALWALGDYLMAAA